MNIANLLVRAGRAYAERPAIAIGDRPHATYGTLAANVAVMAANLRHRHGLVPGDRVALVMNNSPQYIEVLFACWHAGLTAVPINAKLAAKEFEYILAHSASKLCFTNGDLAATLTPLQAVMPDLRAIIDVGSACYDTLSEGVAMAVAPRAATDTAWLFYTSGTTGRPKGAMLSNRCLLAMTGGYFIDVDTITTADSILHAAPMSHGSGIYILPHVAAGAQHIVPQSGRFEADEVLALIKAHRGVSFFAAPTMIQRLVGNAATAPVDTRNLKTIVYGGGPMYVEDCKRALDCFGNKLVQIYGQGESPMTITVLSKAHHADSGHPRYAHRLASVGIAQAIVEIQVTDNDDKPLPPGTAGEVLVRGDSLMSGYWQDPAATAITLRGGWLHTGDIGSLDEHGFLTLKDRSKDVIISGGSNIYPREIEEILLRHPAVLEAAVVGRPDAEWGEITLAFIVCRPDQTLTAQELDTLCLEHIARFKRPRDYRFVVALPKNNYGKVLKTALREIL